VIACGNGWVERSLLDRGVAEEFDAFDPAEHYLREAESEKGARRIRYFRDSFETFEPEGEYDLVVNVAALHHAQHLYRHLSRLVRGLSADGVFVNWEYVGPSRNQYSDAHVALMEAVNADLAPRFQTRHGLRPGLLGTVRGDATEAVHSAEIVDAVDAYFEFLEFKPLGGGIAYQIMWNNVAELARDDAEARAALTALIRADDEQTQAGAVPNLFAYFVCRRRTGSNPRLALRRFAWQHLIEPAREAFARLALGFYPSELAAWLVRKLRARLTGRRLPAVKRSA
jgi:SAM-dependent methyltransferase